MSETNLESQNTDGSSTDIHSFLVSFNHEVNNGDDEFVTHGTYRVIQTEDGSTEIFMDEAEGFTPKLESVDAYQDYRVVSQNDVTEKVEYDEPELTVLKPVSAASLNVNEGTDAIQILSSQSECFETNTTFSINTEIDKTTTYTDNSFTNHSVASPSAQILATTSDDVSYVLIVADQDGDKEHLQAVDLSLFDFKKAHKKKNKKDDDKDNKPLICNYCDYTATKRSDLQKHMRSHNDEKPHKCNICEYGFRSVTALQNHINTHTGVRPHKCKECKSAFTTAGELVRHVRYRHTFEKPHKCPECDYSSVELSKLKRHIRSHTGERPYKCPICSYASPDTFKLKRHLRIHTGEKPYECEICGARFTQSNSLKNHMPIHTGLKTLYQCELCPTTCGRKTDLKVHVQKMHTSDKPMICRKCGKSFPDRYTFRIHAKIHEGEKCFKCELCPYAALNERFLQSHIYTHTGEKPFKCPHCVHSFRQKQLLKRHLNLYHNPSYIAPAPRPRKYECDDCGKCFAHEANLRKHMLSHDDPNYVNIGLEEGEEEMQYVQIVSENGIEREGVQLQLVSEDGQNTIYLQMEDDDNNPEIAISTSLLESSHTANEEMMEEVVVHRTAISDSMQEIQTSSAVEVVSNSNFNQFLNNENLNQSPHVQYVYIKPENDTINDMDLVVTKEETIEPAAKKIRFDLDSTQNEETYTFAVEIEDVPYTDINI